MNRKIHIMIGMLLTLALAISFFMLGAFLAGKLGLAQGQGLAGEAIVLGYVLMAGTHGEELLHIEMFIPEARPPETEAELAITDVCLRDHPQLEAPQIAAGEIHRANGVPKNCN
jgi:hypothetical protein